MTQQEQVEPPRISVSIVTERADLFFHRAVHSVLAQSVPPSDVVVVVDGYSAKLEREPWITCLPESWRIVWTEAENSGPSTPRNVGMYYADGDWILILDGDDFIVPPFIETYTKTIPNLTADIIAEFTSLALIHSLPNQVSASLPKDRTAWLNIVRNMMKGLLAGSWRKGEIPLRPVLIKNDGKKYYPQDFNFLEDRVLLFDYMLEERSIFASDYAGYVRNFHPLCYTRVHGVTLMKDEQRFKKLASNVSFSSWTLRDKILDSWKSYAYLTSDDLKYIENTIKYFSSF